MMVMGTERPHRPTRRLPRRSWRGGPVVPTTASRTNAGADGSRWRWTGLSITSQRRREGLTMRLGPLHVFTVVGASGCATGAGGLPLHRLGGSGAGPVHVPRRLGVRSDLSASVSGRTVDLRPCPVAGVGHPPPMPSAPPGSLPNTLPAPTTSIGPSVRRAAGGPSVRRNSVAMDALSAGAVGMPSPAPWPSVVTTCHGLCRVGECLGGNTAVRIG